MDDNLDVLRIEFDTVANALREFGRGQCGAATQERVEYEVAPCRGIQQRIGYERYWLRRRMAGEQVAFLAASSKRSRPRVLPHIGAIAAITSELHVVPVRPRTVFEQENQFVLAPVVGAHAGIVLDPHAQVFQFAVLSISRNEKLQLVPPIHAYEMQRSVDTMPYQLPDRSPQEA